LIGVASSCSHLLRRERLAPDREERIPSGSGASCLRGKADRCLVPGERIELPTNGLQNRCSTAELTRHIEDLASASAFCHRIAIARK
jgi:hypothetical protein